MTFGKLCEELDLTPVERELAWAYILVIRRLPRSFWKKYKPRPKRGFRTKALSPSSLSLKMWRHSVKMRKVKA